ncbi:MAG: Recombinase [Parcubacteria group bacterium GW2011_GWA1_49_11]|nr:MAG: Recombinase [Parcubacteria group bacterium GW2011_GWA1_49_11]
MENSQTKTKCVLYARKSTEEDDKQVMSIEAQLFELEEYAHRERIQIVKVFTEAKSAKKPGREEFAKMIKYIEESKEPIGILGWHPDRLARNSVDGGKIIYLVDINKIASLRFPQFWFEPTPQGKFMLQVAFGQSKYFSDNLVENVKRGIRQKIRRGEWLTLAPMGYVNNFKTHNIDPDPVKSRVIKRAFTAYATGKYTLVELADFLADHGVVQKKGTPFAKCSVVKMLTNRAYIGFVKHRGEWHDGTFKPILSLTLFEAVQKILSARRKPRKSNVRHPFPFTQFMTCGECGCAITAQYATNRYGVTYTYYRCTKKNGNCAQPYIQQNLLAEKIQKLLQAVSIPREEIEKMEKQITEWESESISSRGDVIQNLKTKLFKTKEKLDKLVSLYLDGDIEREIYLERKDLLLRQKAKFEESFRDFRQQGKNRLEPLRSFVLSLREAMEFEKTSNHLEWKKFFQSIGSNPSLKDKTVSIHWGELWDFVASAKGGSGLPSASFHSENSLPIPTELTAHGAPAWDRAKDLVFIRDALYH